eukprot:COSAG01_NODE_6063_length_3874_cov_5.778278_2_plen_75_part_00
MATVSRRLSHMFIERAKEVHQKVRTSPLLPMPPLSLPTLRPLPRPCGLTNVLNTGAVDSQVPRERLDAQALLRL